MHAPGYGFSVAACTQDVPHLQVAVLQTKLAN